MGQKILTGLKWLFLVAFLTYIYNYIHIYIQPELIFHAQQPPFFCNYAFFLNFIDYPGGIIEYLGNFLAQSFYLPAYGCISIVLSCLLLILLTKFVVFKTFGTNKGYFWMYIPIVFVLYLLHNYYFPFYIVLKAIFAISFVALIMLFDNKKRIITIVFPLLGILLYYIAGSAALIIYLLTVSIICLFKADNKNRFIIPFIALVCAALLPYLGGNFFNISNDKLWFTFMPDLSAVIKYTPDKMLYYFFFSIPGTILLLSLFDLYFQFLKKSVERSDNDAFKLVFELNSKFNWINYLYACIGGTLIIILFVTIPTKAYNQHKKNIVLVDYYAENGDWQKVIDVALPDNEYDIFLNFNYNRAIYNTGKFAELFFNYPQRLGADGLFPDKVTAGQITLPASDLYYEVGYISEALHWAYEAHSTMPNSCRVIRRLVMTNLIERRYNAAATFLGILKSGFYQDDFVNKYLPYTIDTSLASKDPEIKEKRMFMPVDAVTRNSAAYRFNHLYNISKENKRALEYLAMIYLMEHKLGGFIKLFPDLKELYKDKLPVTYELAAVLYILKTEKKDFGSYSFSDETKQIFIGFNKTMKQHNNDKLAAQNTLMNSFGDTYIYYLTYLSPLVTKSSLKTRETN